MGNGLGFVGRIVMLRRHGATFGKAMGIEPARRIIISFQEDPASTRAIPFTDATANILAHQLATSGTWRGQRYLRRVSRLGATPPHNLEAIREMALLSFRLAGVSWGQKITDALAERALELFNFHGIRLSDKGKEKLKGSITGQRAGRASEVLVAMAPAYLFADPDNATATQVLSCLPADEIAEVVKAIGQITDPLEASRVLHGVLRVAESAEKKKTLLVDKFEAVQLLVFPRSTGQIPPIADILTANESWVYFDKIWQELTESEIIALWEYQAHGERIIRQRALNSLTETNLGEWFPCIWCKLPESIKEAFFDSVQSEIAARIRRTLALETEPSTIELDQLRNALAVLDQERKKAIIKNLAVRECALLYATYPHQSLTSLEMIRTARSNDVVLIEQKIERRQTRALFALYEKRKQLLQAREEREKYVTRYRARLYEEAEELFFGNEEAKEEITRVSRTRLSPLGGVPEEAGIATADRSMEETHDLIHKFVRDVAVLISDISSIQKENAQLKEVSAELKIAIAEEDESAMLGLVGGGFLLWSLWDD